MTSITFSINRKSYSVCKGEFPVTMSVLSFIRNHAKLPGTKFSCLEGGCGACLIVIKGIHPITKALRVYSVNSCLKLLYTCDGLEIVTIEGIGNKVDGYHALQLRLNETHGSQCGFCTPGMIVNAYSMQQGSEQPLRALEIERSFGGNICRCTGYRPILDAFKSFASDSEQALLDSCNLSNMDIEEVASMKCPKSGEQCASTCLASRKPVEPLKIDFIDGRQWYRVVDVQSILDIFVEIQAKPYMLVAGNTAHGIYRLNPNLQVFIDINTVDELHSSELSAANLRIGANVSIAETLQIFRKTGKTRGFEYCDQLANHLENVANMSVRNVGTLAGNFSIKYAHKEFPSDLFTIFSACNAMVKIVGVNKYQALLTPSEYLKIDMSQKVIVAFVFPKFNQTIVFKSYKVSMRAQNALAYVNAAFNLRIQNGIVAQARICYGGINPRFVHAKATEAFIVARNLFHPADLSAILTCLANELNPDWVQPNATPVYRKNLALALFYRCVLSIAPNVQPRHLSGAQPLQRPISSGTQTYETNKDKYPLTKPVTKYDGLLQCSGEAGFANDIPPMKDELWAAFVVATSVGKKIATIYPDTALAIPGVRYFYSAKDIPGKNNFTPLWLPFNTEDEEIFVGANSLIKFHSQPIGIIVADTMELAVEAAAKVRITYKSEQSSPSLLSAARSLLNPLMGEVADPPVIPTIKDAFDLNATDRFRPSNASLTPTNVGLNATKTITGRFNINGQYHHHMEMQTCVCIPSENGINVHSATQWFDLAQIAIADCLGIPESKIHMKVRRIGGAFGAKLSRAVQISASCALACHLSKRPVRFVMTMEANMKSVGKRYSCYSDYSIAVDDNGKIQEMTNNFSQDYGCSMNESIAEATLFFFPHIYDSTKWTVNIKKVLTDAPSNTFCRAPGALEGFGMIENIMEHIGYATGRDPMDIRLMHATAGHPLAEIATNFLADIDYKQRQADCAEFNAKNRWRKRSISAVPVQWPVIYYGVMPAYVAIYHHDGSVVISHGGIECGQGINTKAAQVAAFTLGIPLEMVSIRPTTSDFSANSHWTAGSSGSDMVCFAVKKSCEELLERMKPIRDTMPANYTWAQLTLACQLAYIDLRAMYQNKLNELPIYPIYGMAATEMEVDILTGQYHILRVDILEDVGQSMSPLVDVGQIEGAFVMGLGYWLTEKLVYDRVNGELLTNRTLNYKVPGALDIPIDFRITFLPNSPIPHAGILGSKAVGEPATCLAISAMFALRNALRSARTDAGLADEFIAMGSACTPENVFLAAGNSVKLFKL